MNLSTMGTNSQKKISGGAQPSSINRLTIDRSIRKLRSYTVLPNRRKISDFEQRVNLDEKIELKAPVLNLESPEVKSKIQELKKKRLGSLSRLKLKSNRKIRT